MPTLFPISLEKSIGQDAANAVAQQYGFVVEPAPLAPCLAVTEQGLTLIMQDGKTQKSFTPILDDPDFLQRQEEGKTLLLKALGKRQAGDTIIDATAGLLRDALCIRLHGLSVLALERSPVLYALMKEALLRAKENPALRMVLQNQFEFMHTDAKDFFQNDPRVAQASVIYLDPMFEESKKTAEVKAPMQVLRTLLQDEEAPGLLLEAALATTVKRIVVKRHKNAPILKATPSQQLIGKRVRFDVYQK